MKDLYWLLLSVGIFLLIFAILIGNNKKHEENIDHSTLYPIPIDKIPYPSEIVDTIVFPPHQATGYWDTKDHRLKVLVYVTDDGKEYDVIVYNNHADRIISDIFDRKHHLITEVDIKGNHYAIHVIKPE